MSKYKVLLKDTMVFAIGSIGSKIIVFFLVPLYTNVLTTAEYGTADLVFTFSQLMMPVVCLAIYNSIIRFGLASKDKPENTLCCGMFVWLLGCILSIILIPIIGLYRPIAEWKWLLVLHVNASILFSISQNYIKVKGENLKYSIISIFYTLVLALLNIVLLLLLKLGVKGYLLSNALSSLCAAIIAIIFGNVFGDLKKGRIDRPLLKDMIRYSAPLIFNNIAWWVIQSSDKIMIEMYVGVAAVGLYTVATRIPSLINVVVSIFQDAWGISSITEMDSSNDNKFYANVFNVYQILVFSACIAINSIIKPFMYFYVGHDFFDAWKMAPILVVSAASFSAVAAFYGSLYGALKKSVNNMITTVIGAVVNITANYILIHIIGAMGAVVGTLISYFVLALVRMIDVHRYVKIDISYSKYVMNCLIVIVGAILISLDFYGYIVSLFSILLFVFINKKELAFIFSKVPVLFNKIGGKSK